MRSVGVGLAALVAALTIAGSGYAEQVVRRNWVPGGNYPDRGDLWTFKCPSGGSVTASVQTVVDLSSTNVAAIDPLFVIFDATGTAVGSADDTVVCAVPSACGFSCPSGTSPCGQGVHSIVVRTSGSGGDDRCAHGGGYVLTIETFNANGDPQPASKLKLGGGPKYKVPKALLAVDADVGSGGPAIDDGRVPN